MRHFVGQHVECSTHQRLARQQQLATEEIVAARKVPCEGLCVDDEEQANQLYSSRAEFHLWATYSNFTGSAKHSYWHSANEGSWFVSSTTCLQECDERPSMQRQVCQRCVSLGKAHGVFRALLFDEYLSLRVNFN